MFDRQFALYDLDGNCVNGKREPQLNRIRTTYDLSEYTVSVSAPSRPQPERFNLVEEQFEIAKWFSTVLDRAVVLRRDEELAFPDDTYSRGPTIISYGSIQTIDSWFGISDLEETRRRFRTNIELNVEIPFWEDRLFGKRGDDVSIRFGDAQLWGAGPCKRCIVPTRDSLDGSVTDDFQAIFSKQRLATFPEWANRARFGPLMFRVAVNTRSDGTQEGKCIRVGDRLILDESSETE